MTTLSARITQSPIEVKRYELDYTAQLADGETVASLTFVISGGPTVPVVPFMITNVAIAPGGLLAVFYASGGDDENIYEVQFLAVTSIAQTFEDVVEFNVVEKLS